MATMVTPTNKGLSMAWLAVLLLSSSPHAQEVNFGVETVCSADFLDQCQVCEDAQSSYDCSLPGLSSFTPGQYEGVKANYLSFVTNMSSPSMPVRARQFEACTGATISFSDSENIFEDPVADLGSSTAKGSEVFDAYFMSYSHFPEVSALGLAEHLNDRIRQDNDRLKWEDVMPKVRQMGEYRKDGETNIDFLSFDGDFFVPIVRLDLLEKHNIPLPNTWEEVVAIAKRFHGTDINGDGEPDYGLCHFPRLGFGYWDWWFTESVYSTWATMDQTDGIEQGFLFDVDTMEPRTNSSGFKAAVSIWKDLWMHAEQCEGLAFEQGQCAIGYGPPGCWKGVFLNGVARSETDPTTNITDVVWEPTMKSGEYAAPYRFKPYGSVNVVDRSTGDLVPCTPEICPKAEVVPARGHHGDDDRASVLPVSPYAGQLINRAPFYWSGSLGTLIRKSSAEAKKDVMWDFFVYANSPETSIHDVANYESWLDSWRFSQLSNGENFRQAGWHEAALNEHMAVQKWAMSSNVNGAFNLRVAGVAKYTRDVMGGHMTKFIDGEINIDELVEGVTDGWNEINRQEGKLRQLETYRASLLLEPHTEFELCELHRDLMDERDPSICRQYDPDDTNSAALIAVIVAAVLVVVAMSIFLCVERYRRSVLEEKQKKLEGNERDEILEVEKLTKSENTRLSIARMVFICTLILSCILLSKWVSVLLSSELDEGFLSDSPETYVYLLAGSFALLLLVFIVYDWLVRVRNKKLILNAAKSSEIMTTMFPDDIREKLLNETRTNKKTTTKKQQKVEVKVDTRAMAELYPETTVLFADVCGFAAWASSRQPQQVFLLLEKVFGAIDMLARKHRVYKVETIADCYVAITGAPKAQQHHAQRMSRFACAFVKKFSSLSRNLVVEFGLDTAELSLRVGIHSGQVTMGVLRNERARYQLFGDSVHIAALMKSTSEPGQVQISRESADSLIASGKEHWFSTVDGSAISNAAKLHTTFWLRNKVVLDDRLVDTHHDLTGTGSNDSESMEKFALHRLIEWNTATLLSLVKKIVAHRANKVSTLTDKAQETFALHDSKTYLEEVAEIIHLPKEKGTDLESVDLDSIEIDPVAVHELRTLVECIAELYNDNPFHNFEHASHVTLSIIKLLSRIVKPSDREIFSGEKAHGDGSVHDRSYGITSDPLTQFACAFCGLIHDAAHPGVPNTRMIEEEPGMGARYKERSVAEQNSLSVCFQLLSEDRFDNLRRVLFSSNEDQARFRGLVVNSVMATDIVDKDLKALRNGRWQKAFDAPHKDEPIDVTVNRKATIVIEHLIQASDVSHTMQHWNVYRKWNEKLLQEFYLAYKEGRSTNDPTINWAKGEIGFFDFYIIPLAKKLKDCGVFGVSSDEYLNYAMINRQKWEEEGPAITAEMIERLNEGPIEGAERGIGPSSQEFADVLSL